MLVNCQDDIPHVKCIDVRYVPEHRHQNSSLKTVRWQCLSDHMRQPSELANAHRHLVGWRVWDLPMASFKHLLLY
jgi:hypothetical protein